MKTLLSTLLIPIVAITMFPGITIIFLITAAVIIVINLQKNKGNTMPSPKKWGITIILTIITLVFFWPATPFTFIIGTILTLKNSNNKQEKSKEEGENT